jgi:cytosine permease
LQLNNKQFQWLFLVSNAKRYNQHFLNLLGVFTPSISAIYIIDFFWLKNQQYDLDKIQKWGKEGLISWGVSSIVTLFTYNEVFQITQAYFVDSFLVAGIVYLFLNRKLLKKQVPSDT